MTSTSRYYLGTLPHLLNPIDLDYEWFGVLWLEEEHHFPIIVGYWFSKEKSEIIHDAIQSGFSTWTEISDHQTIMRMYESIRNKQKKQDWERRTRLSIRTIFKSPWSEVSSGLYIIKSRETYPLHVSAILKKKFFVWLEHAAVCETEAELRGFMQRVSEEHQMET
ncbi:MULTISPECIES: hypothetical protein [unclassified Paenibacillus]|uniref:hypothetical protein n=1 Tax=unclassified Paenibacillus TaxID=185978 RepID=UPI0006FC6103|nr:hypothetical protein [Paenibacillus sp. Soil750]KRE75508.1 hypothetical protein ASL11_01345 [Paenibacillus sp. Soil750]